MPLEKPACHHSSWFVQPLPTESSWYHLSHLPVSSEAGSDQNEGCLGTDAGRNVFLPVFLVNLIQVYAS